MRVLLSAFACAPGEGSEPGVGWEWSQRIAQRHEVWVLLKVVQYVKLQHASNLRGWGGGEKRIQNSPIWKRV